MEQPNIRPKSFGEVLDTAFSISKNNFGSLFLILLLLMGPVFLVDYIFMLLSGASLIKEATEGGIISQIDSNVQSGGVQALISQNAAPGLEFLYYILNGIMAIALYPMAHASVLYATSRDLKQQSWSVSEVIKRAFSRFWPLVGSTLLFGLVVGGGFAIGIIFISLIGFGAFSGGAGIGALIISVLFILGLFILAAFFTVKLSMYFAATAFEKTAPGFSRSWNLTKGHFWSTFGLFIVFILINILISAVFEGVAIFVLGTSVFSQVLINLAAIVTTLLLMVGYAVIYTDLKVRNEAGDLKDMISTYKKESDEPSTSFNDR